MAKLDEVAEHFDRRAPVRENMNNTCRFSGIDSNCFRGYNAVDAAELFKRMARGMNHSLFQTDQRSSYWYYVQRNETL